MDVCMPEISGIEALDKIKALNPRIPIVMMTAYSSNEAAAQALEKGAYGYLSKPFDFDNLRRTIEGAVEHSHTHQKAVS
jgi:two-component system response regulator HydG